MSGHEHRFLRAALATLGVAFGMVRGVVALRSRGWFRRARRAYSH